ncbi:unnamed protein product, partial [Ectocarpus sp. 12 AP-2014]
AILGEPCPVELILVVRAHPRPRRADARGAAAYAGCAAAAQANVPPAGPLQSLRQERRRQSRTTATAATAGRVRVRVCVRVRHRRRRRLAAAANANAGALHRALPVDPVHGPQPLRPARRLLPHHAQSPYRPPRQGRLPTAADAARHRCRGGRGHDDSTNNHGAPAGGRLGVDSRRAADASSSR